MDIKQDIRQTISSNAQPGSGLKNETVKLQFAEEERKHEMSVSEVKEVESKA